jgi:hypothetical protein
MNINKGIIRVTHGVYLKDLRSTSTMAKNE